MPHNIVRIVEYINKDMLTYAEDLVDRIKSGEVKGAIIALKLDECHHETVLLGDYSRNPATACAVAGKIFSSISKRIDELGHYQIIDTGIK